MLLSIAHCAFVVPFAVGREYAKHKGYDCYEGYGGTPMNENDESVAKNMVFECEEICEQTEGCVAITHDAQPRWSRQPIVGDCWLRSAVNLTECDLSRPQSWDTFTAIIPAPPPGPPRPSWSPIPPEYATNVTLYHINPLSLGVVPSDQDTGDALGDMFFDLRSKVLPFECAQYANSTWAVFDCQNPEVIADDLVITQLVLEVDNRFGKYGMCNVCVEQTDRHSTKNCTDGEYVCDCGGYTDHTPCGASVGFQNLTETHAKWGGCNDRYGTPQEWQCWQGNVVKKTTNLNETSWQGGLWYSTHKDGYCGDGSQPPPPGCTWRVVEITKAMNKTCHDENVYNVVETYDDDAKQCFADCEDSGLGKARNTSSQCWIGCFFTTMLGPESGKVNGTIAGMPYTTLLNAWMQPFRSTTEEEGGCPAIPVDDQGFPKASLII